MSYYLEDSKILMREHPLSSPSWGISTSWELVAVFINSSDFSRTFPSRRNLRALQGLWVVTGNSETEKLEEKRQGTEMRRGDKEQQERHVQSQA